MNEEYVQGNKKVLAVLVGVFSLLIAMPVVIPKISEQLVNYDPQLAVANMDAALSKELAKATWALGMLNLVYAILGMLMLYFGVKILMTRRFPPFGLATPFRIRVKTGAETLIFSGVFCILGAIFVVKAAAFVWFWLWKLL